MCNKVGGGKFGIGDPEQAGQSFTDTDPVGTPRQDFIKTIGHIDSIYPFKSPREYAINLQQKNPAEFKKLVDNGIITLQSAPITEPDPLDYQRKGNALNTSAIFFNPKYQKDTEEYWQRNSTAPVDKAGQMRQLYGAMNKKKI